MDHEFLEHYGVKGMKWGVRKTPARTAKTLTNKELKKRVDRLNMEKRYSDLTKETQRATMSSGQRLVNEFVDSYGNRYPKAVGKKAADRTASLTVKAVESTFRKKVGDRG